MVTWMPTLLMTRPVGCGRVQRTTAPAPAVLAASALALALAGVAACSDSVGPGNLPHPDASAMVADVGTVGADTADAPDAASLALPPRQVAPLSTSVVTSQRPILRWTLGSGNEGAEVTLCRNRRLTT